MIKLESIVKSNKVKNENSVTFQLSNNKINYIYSRSKEDVTDFFNIMSGFYHPKLGYVVYDNVNFTELSIYDRANFIQENIEVVTPFTFSDQNRTVYSVIKRHLIFVNNSGSKKIDKTINEWLKYFRFFSFRNRKLKYLTNLQLIKLHVLLMRIKNPKYILISDFEKYLFSKKSYHFFFALLEKYISKQSYIIFFSNQENWNNDLNCINLNSVKNLNENWMLIRNSFFKPATDKRISPYNFFLLLREIFNSSYIFSLLFFCLNTFLISIFAVSNVNYTPLSPETDVFRSIRFVLIFTLIILNLVYIWILYYYNIYLIFRMTRCGQNVFWVVFLYCIYYLFIYLIGWIISFIYPLSTAGNPDFLIDWTTFIIVGVAIFIISIIIFILIFALANKNMIKKNNDFI